MGPSGNKKILYFDKVYDEFKQILYAHKPEGLDLWFWEDMNERERGEKLPQADYLLVATQRLDQKILAASRKARFVQKTGIGVDNIDLDAATRCGLPVANTPGGNAAGVAELTILHILALYRKLPYVNQATKSGRWLMWEMRPSSYEMEGKTHGIIGFGNIGKEVARRSKGMGTRIVYFDLFRADAETERNLDAVYMPLEELLEVADIVSLHIPLTEQTKHLIGEPQLRRMKNTAILINVSRGGVVSEPALYKALREGWIAGAGIDVWEQEPVPPDNPLLQLEQVIATPHLGAGTRDTLEKVLGMAFANIARVEAGLPPMHVVNGIKVARFSDH